MITHCFYSISGTTPSSTASTTQAQPVPPDFLQGFVESIMQSAGKWQDNNKVPAIIE